LYRCRIVSRYRRVYRRQGRIRRIDCRYAADRKIFSVHPFAVIVQPAAQRAQELSRATCLTLAPLMSPSPLTGGTRLDPPL
jgi:hypothetical protein